MKNIDYRKFEKMQKALHCFFAVLDDEEKCNQKIIDSVLVNFNFNCAQLLQISKDYLKKIEHLKTSSNKKMVAALYTFEIIDDEEKQAALEMYKIRKYMFEEDFEVKAQFIYKNRQHYYTLINSIFTRLKDRVGYAEIY